MYPRTLESIIRKKVGRGKAIMVIGPRQVGKTTMILKELAGKAYQFFDGDDPTVRALLNEPNPAARNGLCGRSQRKNTRL